MKEEINKQKPLTPEEKKKREEALKKQKAKAETARFKSKYFEYYDDIKISDRQDW